VHLLSIAIRLIQRGRSEHTLLALLSHADEMHALQGSGGNC